MDDIDNNLVKVKIYGQVYTVKAQADSTYIVSVAKYVNEKMQEIENSLSSTQSPLRIAILAAMNITDELFTSNKNKEEVISSIDEKAKFLADIIDQKLEE